MGDLRVFLVHSEVRSYRVPLFELLHQSLDITFIFAHGTRWAKKWPESKQWKFVYLRPYNFPGYSADVVPGLIPYLFSRRRDFDAIILSGIFSFTTHVGLIVAKLLGKRVYLWDETWVMPTNWRARLLAPYLRLMARLADGGIAAGSRAQRFYQSLGMAESKITVAVNCALDLQATVDRQAVATLRAKLGLPPKAVVIGYMGRVVRYKNLDCLIRAFATLRGKFADVHLLIVGDGPYSPECQRLLDELGADRVYWVRGDGRHVEPVSHQQMCLYLAATDIFVLPGRMVEGEVVPCEAWGLTLNEAMSLGKPVVSTTSVAGAFDLIADGQNGFRIEADNPAAMSRALKKMIQSPSLRRQMGARSRQIVVSQFSYPRQLQGFLDMLKPNRSRRLTPRAVLKRHYISSSPKVVLYNFLRLTIFPVDWFVEKTRGLSGDIACLGCGYGTLETILAVNNPSGRFFASDLVADRIDTARRSVQGVANIEFAVQDVTKLAKSRTFNHIICIDLLHHLADGQQTILLGKLWQRLESGGTMIIKDVDTQPRWKYYWNFVHDRIMAGLPLTYHPSKFYADYFRSVGSSRVKLYRPTSFRSPYNHYVIEARKG